MVLPGELESKVFLSKAVLKTDLSLPRWSDEEFLATTGTAWCQALAEVDRGTTAAAEGAMCLVRAAKAEFKAKCYR